MASRLDMSVKMRRRKSKLEALLPSGESVMRLESQLSTLTLGTTHWTMSEACPWPKKSMP